MRGKERRAHGRKEKETKSNETKREEERKLKEGSKVNDRSSHCSVDNSTAEEAEWELS